MQPKKFALKPSGSKISRFPKADNQCLHFGIDLGCR